MIPVAQITQWRSSLADDMQVEQDLILSRMIVEFSDPFLRRIGISWWYGATHDVFTPAARYSEDIDL